MELIPQNKIDEAARHYADGYFIYEMAEYLCNPYDAFNEGVQFALNEIQPLMVEFKDFCDKYELYGEKYSPVKKTTQQLLEEFIKSKNK